MTDHRCTGACVCPIHQTPMRYWPAGDDHACQVPDCPNSQGFRHLAVDLEVTITADTGRLDAALQQASRSMRGAGFAALAASSLYGRAIAQAAERDAEQARTQQMGRDIGLSKQDTGAVIEQVLTAAAKGWHWNLSTSEVYREARRGLNARANGLRFLPFQQDLERFLTAFAEDPTDGKGWPECL